MTSYIVVFLLLWETNKKQKQLKGKRVCFGSVSKGYRPYGLEGVNRQGRHGSLSKIWAHFIHTANREEIGSGGGLSNLKATLSDIVPPAKLCLQRVP